VEQRGITLLVDQKEKKGVRTVGEGSAFLKLTWDKKKPGGYLTGWGSCKKVQI